MTKEQVNAFYNSVLEQCADVIMKAMENGEKDGTLPEFADEYSIPEFVALHISEKVWHKIHM